MSHRCRRFCYKSFCSLSWLLLHERLHTGEKPYICDIFGIRVAQKSNLKQHMKIHIGDKPYSCEICGKSFIRKHDLYAKHMKVHKH